jgi:single-strand DNA-binding protein
MVEGRLQLDTWEDRNGGGQRSRLRVVSENIQFMSRRRDDNGAAPAYNNQGNFQNGNSYNGGYQGGYQQSGGYQDNSYQSAPMPQSAPPRRPMDAPPMPAPDFGGSENIPEDDIPF